MEKLWDNKSPLVFHSEYHWGKLTKAQIKKHPVLNVMVDRETILITDDSGIVFDFTFLDVWKTAYGVDIDDPQESLEECIRIRNTPKETLEDLQQQVEFQAQALEELITLTLEQ